MKSFFIILGMLSLTIQMNAVAGASGDAQEQRQLASFRNSLAEGDHTNCGLVIEKKAKLAKIQIKASNTELWMKLDDLYPVGRQYQCSADTSAINSGKSGSTAAAASSTMAQVDIINSLLETYTRESVTFNNQGTSEWLRNVSVKLNSCDMLIKREQAFTFSDINGRSTHSNPNWIKNTLVLSLDKVSSFKAVPKEQNSWSVIASCNKNCLTSNNDGNSYNTFAFSNIQTSNAANSLAAELSKFVNQCSVYAKPESHANCEEKYTKYAKYILELYLTNPNAKNLTLLDFEMDIAIGGKLNKLDSGYPLSVTAFIEHSGKLEQIVKDVVDNKGGYNQDKLSNLVQKVCSE